MFSQVVIAVVGGCKSYLISGHGVEPVPQGGSGTIRSTLLPAGLMVFWFILGCSTELFKINQKLSCSLLCELCVLKSRASERVVNKKDERQLILTLGVLCAFA